MSGFEITLLSLATMGLVSVIGFLVGSYCERCDNQDEAVESGHAEYYLDENHTRQFRWKPTQNHPTKRTISTCYFTGR